ncbi:MAG: hypothetical protein PWQ51_1930 [Methanolobus sp.]|jgi:hypothetical protein|uniref:hypothetical protein n=1 Tax=Methanolobus sp. TaxID=1874737 RepID=UPI0024AC3C56|nr:hypothetical protein [Methanolobus sp.]MDI3486469.1 hypothetical protein [Methanolobus sp.]MDK2831530.1 hypothetical protein [Methanolobus sp.]MDK2939765.1 hypothetical protein [Methanolobus sp.]
MNLKPSTSKNTKYALWLKKAIKNPSNSIYFILGIPFLYALFWVLQPGGDLSPPFILVPTLTVIIYAYFTRNKLASAILGLALFSLTMFYLDFLYAVLNYSNNIFMFLTWNRIISSILDMLPFSIIHLIIGASVASRKKEYLLIAAIMVLLLVFIVRGID